MEELVQAKNRDRERIRDTKGRENIRAKARMFFYAGKLCNAKNYPFPFSIRFLSRTYN